MSYDKSRTPADERPLAWNELLSRGQDIEPTEEVPKELTHLWSDLSIEREIALTLLEPDSPIRPDPTASHRPPWVGSAIKPRPAPRVTHPRLFHRGVPVDPLVVWGADDRRTYNDTRYPWVCVCRVLTAGGRGSGVLVGPRHVLTASHVVDWDHGASIEVHRAGATAQATARVIAGWAMTRITGDPGGSTLDEDYAVLVTDQRLGDRFGWLGVRTYSSGWDDEDLWRSIGYAGDVADHQFPVYQRDKELDEDEFDLGGGRAMTTAADLMPGQSGSPMFAFWDDGPYVVAVASAVGNVFLSGTENWCSGGNDLTRLVRDARAGDP